ncbi:MAG: hypothetical protein IE909_18685 [Campylobacterales bacterium]|nr:hypothetical protein [Campylobacterales bacterium]
MLKVIGAIIAGAIAIPIIIYIISSDKEATAKFDNIFSTKHQKFQETVKDYQESTKDGIFSPNDPSKFVQETNNNTVAKVDTKIAVQQPANKEKAHKDDFDRSFDKFDKEFDKKWKNF